MRVFHGSKVVVESPDVKFGRDGLDFGKGFYTTSIRGQAENWVRRFLRLGSRAFVSEYEFDREAAVRDFRFRRFESYDEGWLDFVLSNRGGGSDFLRYDIVEGGIADDRVFNTVELYLDGLIGKAEALKRLRYERPNDQICFISQEAADRLLRFLSAEEVLQ